MLTLTRFSAHRVSVLRSLIYKHPAVQLLADHTDGDFTYRVRFFEDNCSHSDRFASGQFKLNRLQIYRPAPEISTGPEFYRWNRRL